jgi:valyl-tRNA synthetase
MEEFPKAYDAKAIEQQLYQFWENAGFFSANPNSSKPPYSIVMPPPNVTGVLHMGHALVNTLQDILIRWKRCCGFEALWVPGTDHAGIATQTVVERHLMRTLGKKRKDFSREEFLAHVWRWKEENQGQIIQQLKRLGCSCDWSRLRFTMDDTNNRAVKTIFKRLYEANLIYRGDYLVNWDPVTQTALADDEVEYEEKNSFLWFFRYPLKNSQETIEIATTRPETMLGDTAIAVSPKDPRYQKLIGQTAIQPMTGRELPIIADPFVDPEFGTGAVKITPAHDPNDYQMALNHKLPIVNIMTPDGSVNENGGRFQGLTMAAAREEVVQAMKELRLLVKIAPHILRVGVSYRSKALIEPCLSKQWFVRMDRFAPKLRSLVVEGKVKLIPKNWENTYFYWIDNLRDWCISRQLWWGHRIPIWYHKEDPNKIICYDGEGEPEEVQKNPALWTQDEDVLDTWFSSALWPFSTLGWPDNTEELKRFYPNSVLITAHDILFFWVARMLLMGEYAMGEAPFPETFLHGLIYGKSYWRNAPSGGIAYITGDERKEYNLGKPLPKDVMSKWEKLSKSKGNVIDPLEIIDEYGTDAMRIALCASSPEQREIDLDRRRFEEYKNFANKVWNGARFVFMNLSLTSEEFSAGLQENILRLEDHWILSLLNHTVREVNHALSNYQFDQAAKSAYDFFWKEFCAYYVEISKPILFGKAGTDAERKNKQKLLVIVLCQALRLLHPMVPFITEELFQKLKAHFPNLMELNKDPYTQETILALQTASCMVAPYPQVIRESDINPGIEHAFDLVDQLVYTIRNIRGEMKLPPGEQTDVYIIGEGAEFQTVQQNQEIIKALVRIKELGLYNKEPKVPFASTGVLGGLKVMIPLPHDLMEKEKLRLVKEKEKLLSSLEKLKAQLANEDFVSRAPPHLIENQRVLLNKSEIELREVSLKLEKLNQ